LVYRIDRYFQIGLLIFQTSKELPYGRMTNSDGLIPCPVETWKSTIRTYFFL